MSVCYKESVYCKDLFYIVKGICFLFGYVFIITGEYLKSWKVFLYDNLFRFFCCCCCLLVLLENGKIVMRIVLRFCGNVNSRYFLNWVLDLSVIEIKYFVIVILRYM